MKTVFLILFRLFVLFPVAVLSDQWPLSPATISTPGSNAIEPCVAVDPNGNIVAVWLENGVVMSSATIVKGTWSSPAAISGSGATLPQVVIDPNGNATAIWAENGLIKAAAKPLGESFSAPAILSANVPSNAAAYSPKIGVDSIGNLVAVWLETGGVLKTSTCLINGSWDGPDTKANYASFPQLAVGSNGSVVLVWQTTAFGSPYYVFVQEKQISGSWEPCQALSLDGINAVYPQVAVDANGNATVVWFQYPYQYPVVSNQYSDVLLQAVMRPAGQSWTSPVTIPSYYGSASLKNPADLVAVIAYNGSSPVVSWTSSDDGSTFNIELAAFVNGAWDVHPRLIQHNWGVYNLSLGINPSGYNSITWMRFDPVSSFLLVEGTSTMLDGSEDVVWTIWAFSNGGQNGYPITVIEGTSSTPVGVLVWLNYNGTNTTVQALTSPFKIVQPPTGVSLIQQGTNFGVVTRYDNVLSWQPSASRNIWGYAIRRNNEAIAATDQSVFEYIDLNQDFNVPMTYQIAALDINGFQSSWVSVSLP